MRMQATSTAIMAAVTWVALTGLTSGDIRGPYASDESTISLWHMEPSGDPVAIPDGAGVRPLDAAGLQGAFQPAGRPEMGQCYDASWRDPGNTSTGYLLGAGPSGEEGTGLWGNIPRGPFTIEMLVSPLRILDPDPLDDEPSRMALARGEDISGYWEVDLLVKTVSGVTSTWVELRTELPGALPASASFPLPVSGFDAPAEKRWYHLAITFTPGENEESPGTASLYWTPFIRSRTQATIAGSAPLDVQGPLPLTRFVLGAGLLDPSTGERANRFDGQIDEVRLSGTVRAADAFLFRPGSPDPADTDLDDLPDAWEMEYFGSLQPGAFEDPDHDGFLNIEEFRTSGDPTKWGGNQGYFRREIWTRLVGDWVKDLYRYDNFFLPPQFDTVERASLEFGSAGVTYGQRISGLLVPPHSGTYRFWISSDNHSELWLSTGDSRFDRRCIARVSGWVDPHDYDAYRSQESDGLLLEAGKEYYFEILHKQGAGVNHVSVAWRMDPGNWCLSKGAVASQSTTDMGLGADRAIDGYSLPYKPKGSFSQTQNRSNSWWAVDLGALRPVDRVVLHNRAEFPARLSNFRILLADADGNELLGRNFFEGEGFVEKSLEWNLPRTIDARQVQVRILGHNNTGDGRLALAEAEVFHVPDLCTRQVIDPRYIRTARLQEGDEDRDGLPDAWETANHLDATDNGLRDRNNSYFADPDGDGFSNLEEYQFGGDPHSPDSFRGNWTREVRRDVPHYSIDDAWQRCDKLYQPTPRVERQESSSTGRLAGEYFASRIRGYIIPPATGNYRFWVSGETAVRLNLSTTSKKWDKRMIAALDPEIGTAHGINYHTENWWDHYASQMSAEVYLEEGKPCFIEILHQHGHSSDAYAAVAWAPPGGDRTLIPAGCMSSYILNDLEDVDDDSLPDLWETQYGLSTTDNGLTDRARQGERGDFDNDGLSNLQEYQLGTNPAEGDTDGDGLSDGAEFATYRSDPRVPDAPAETVVSTVQPASFVSADRPWRMIQGGLISDMFRGGISWDVDVPADGVWVIQASTSLAGKVNASESMDFELSLDGRSLGRQTVHYSAGRHALLRAITPRITAGRHRFRVFVDNYLARRSVVFSSIELRAVSGRDLDGNGWPDWIEAELALSQGVSEHSAWSAVSPAFIEGEARLPDAVTLNTVPVLPGPGPRRWMADLVLSPEGATPYRVVFDTGVAREGAVSWRPTDVMSGGRMVIRPGDSLLLFASSGTSADSPASLSIDGGAPLAATQADPIAHCFAEPGDHVVLATAADGRSGRLDVFVPHASLPDDTVLVQNMVRRWSLTLGEADPSLTYAGCLGLDVGEAEPIGDGRFGMPILAREAGHLAIAARLWSGGPVVDVADVLSVGVSDALQNDLVSAHVSQEFPGYYVLRTPMVITNMPPGGKVVVTIFRAGVMFLDGTTTRTFTDGELADGVVFLEFLFPAGMQGGYCHYIDIYDAGGKHISRR